MITFFKNLIFTLRFNRAASLIVEDCGEVKVINDDYYAVLKNGLVYEIKHYDKFFNVRVFHEGKAISEFKFSSDVKKVKAQGVVNGESIMAHINIKTALSQILSDSPFTRCKPEAFLTLAESMNAQFTSDDYLYFFFQKHYTSIGMVDYKLTIRHSSDGSYQSKQISIINGIIYEKVSNNLLPSMTLKNMQFLDKYCDLLGAFFLNYQDKFCLVYFDLKCMHMIHFVGDKMIEKTSINYHTGHKVVTTAHVEFSNIHRYFENIIYDLIKLKASEHFFEICEKCEITIEDPMQVSEDEMQLFKMATY